MWKECITSVETYEHLSQVKIQAENMPEVEIDNFDQTWNDGIWHRVIYHFS